SYLPLFGGWGAFLFLFSCSGTSHLPKGEKLYTGAVIKLESTEKIDKAFITASIEPLVRPEPNKSYLGMRPQLWLYMLAGENPKGKFKKWIQRQGDAPVYISSVKAAATSNIIDAKLFNIGIFNGSTSSSIVEKKHTAKVIYTSRVHKPYTVKELIYNISNDSISKVIQAEKGNSLIQPGEDYSLDKLSNERLRIDAELKNKGYFYFNPDYLLFKADTSNVDHSVTFKLTLKEDLPENALTSYRINNIFINQNYSLHGRGVDSIKDTVMCQNAVFQGKKEELNIRPTVIMQSVYLRKHEYYSRENHNITLNRLMSMGTFKFVQVKFSDSDTTATGFLDVTILMTPMSNHTFRAELDVVSKSNNYTGPRMNLSFLNRNTFSGAELLNLNMAGSFEAQLSGLNKNLFSYSLNPQVELTFPRFLSPFKIKQSNSLYIPKTRFVISYNFLKRVDYFDMRTFQFIYGFKWKSNFKNEQEFNPLNISYTSLANQSDTFTALLVSNPFLKKSYEEQFIAGMNYAFSFSEQMLPNKKIQFFMHFNAETAGNVFSLAKLIGGEKPNADHPSNVVGSVYSQFAKLSIDGRAYYNFRDKNKLVMRVFAGVGKPFGNSSVLPYSKQFFSGGPNSIRAFQINSVGPGVYNQQVDKTGFLQVGGDIKLEMNGEYRFNIYKYFKGALFVDAGNVWLQKSNPSNTGSPFAFSSFINEMAVGAGVGLRVDVSFFILRFDLAMPLRKPWLEENQRWVIKQIKPATPEWRNENLILNIAIGYPF
ncbi:MAG: BamA/TamA family outer membrane protein, partial [Paludibacter sp.]